MDRDLPLPKCGRFLKDISDGDQLDRISSLPEDILVRILLHLRTKGAVQTSILSKRWEYLWTLTPDLDFSDDFGFTDQNGYIIKSRLFKEYVDRVIFYHGGSTIRKCHLHCYGSYVRQFMYAWVCAVITCNIEELILETSFFDVQELPSRLFTCKTLMVLKIEGMFVLELPNSICFPCLKILCLESVVYVDDSSAQNLFSSCPVLEDLAVTRREWDGLQNISLSIPLLKRLCICSRDYYHICREYKTEINAPCLEYLELGGSICNDYSANFTCSLVEARIYGRCVFGLLNGISGVQNLTLSHDFLWGLDNIIDDHDVPMFHNLKKLELHVGTPVHWEVLPDLLECSPNLEVLVFPTGLVVPKESGRDFYRFYWHRPDSVAECLEMHLKTVEIFNFVGLPGEMYLVDYLLECGEVLEKMIIHGYDYSARPIMRKKMESVKHEVLSFERSSSTCEVVFNI